MAEIQSVLSLSSHSRDFPPSASCKNYKYESSLTNILVVILYTLKYVLDGKGMKPLREIDSMIVTFIHSTPSRNQGVVVFPSSLLMSSFPSPVSSFVSNTSEIMSSSSESWQYSGSFSSSRLQTSQVSQQALQYWHDLRGHSKS